MEHIKINGIEYPFLFGFNAFREFSKQTGIGINELKNEINNHIHNVFIALYISAKEGCRTEKKEIENFSIEYLCDELDKDPAAFPECIKILIKQLALLNPKK